MATWGTDIPEDLELNEEALANALKKVRKTPQFQFIFSLAKTLVSLPCKVYLTCCCLCAGGSK